MKSNYFPSYSFTSSETIGITQRPSYPQVLFIASQHMLAMFGGTILVPLLSGFDTNTCLMFSGIGTLVFYACTGGRVPSYLGSSFSFLGVILAATDYEFVPGDHLNDATITNNPVINPNIGKALGGLIANGVVYGIIGVIVMLTGYAWIEYLLPPVVTGSIIMAIGLNLATPAIANATSAGDSPWQAALTATIVALVSVFAPGILGRLPILTGLTIGFIISILVGLGSSSPIDFTRFNEAPLFAIPKLYYPVWDTSAISLIVPVVIIQVAENLGHVKAVGVIAGEELLPYLGRAYIGDALATILSGCFGGSGLTTYAENIGVMAVTKVYSTLIFFTAACFSIFLGFVPKFGALVSTVPNGVFGGLEIILFGLVAATGARIWIQNRVDFGDPVNLVTAAVAVILGSGMKDNIISIGRYVKLDALGSSTIICIVAHLVLRRIPELFGKQSNKDPVMDSNVEIITSY